MKNKFFLCFRPPLLIEPDRSQILQSDYGVSKSIVVAKDQKKPGSSTIKSTLLDKNKCRFPGQNMSKKTFSSVFELLSLKASLRNTVRDKNIHRLNPQSKKVVSRKMSKRLEDFGNDKSIKPKGIDANIQQKSSDTSILSASSSSNSSYESKNLVPLSMKKLSSQPMPTSTDETCHIATYTCPVSYNIWGLISITFVLFLTMFWGKTIAILFALMWLYAFPLRRWENGEYDACSHRRPESSKEYNKKKARKGQCINVLT